jgi:pyruvate kinase
MVDSPRPTRAEASDVANAIFDGTDAVMLSGETAMGRYPREAVAMMSRIVIQAERNISEFTQPRRRRERQEFSVAETICESIAHAAEDLPMGAIAVFTESGNTARMLSKHRPKARIFAFTRAEQVCNRLNLLWGVEPVHHNRWNSAEEMVSSAEQELLQRKEIRSGDILGVVAGTRLSSGSTNFMRLHHVVTASAVRSSRADRKKAKA